VWFVSELPTVSVSWIFAFIFLLLSHRIGFAQGLQIVMLVDVVNGCDKLVGKLAGTVSRLQIV
jgi:hypothetical protein